MQQTRVFHRTLYNLRRLWWLAALVYSLSQQCAVQLLIQALHAWLLNWKRRWTRKTRSHRINTDVQKNTTDKCKLTRFHNDRNRNVEQSHWQADCEKTKKNEKIPIKKLTVKRRVTAGAWELRKENSTENKLQRTHFFLLIFRCTVRAAGKVSIYCHSTIAHEKVIVCSLLELRQPAGEGIPL